jgi:O-antigen ligase
LLTRSRGGLVGFAVVIVLAVALYTSWRAALAAALAVVLVVLVVPGTRHQVDRISDVRALFGGEVAGDSSAAGYASTFRAGLRMFADKPVSGVGSKNFIEHYPAIAADLGIDTTGARRTTHDVAIELLSETGLIGFVTFTTALVLVVINIVRAKRSFREARAFDSADLQRALLVAVAGFVVTGTTLNLGNPQLLLLTLGMGIAGWKVAPHQSGATADAARK